jgi:hypothetical protein
MQLDLLPFVRRMLRLLTEEAQRPLEIDGSSAFVNYAIRRVLAHSFQ